MCRSESGAASTIRRTRSSRKVSSTSWRMPPAATLIFSGASSWRRSRSNSRSSTLWRPRPDGARLCRRASFAASPSTIRRTAPAQVVEASVASDGKVQVHRVVSAIDAGHVVNPLTVELQTESAVVYGLTAALYGEITIANGQVEQSNFNDYPMLRLADMPRVETVIITSGGFWGGVGETPVPPLAPALCNAIFFATGKRIRSLPLKNHELAKA